MSCNHDNVQQWSAVRFEKNDQWLGADMSARVRKGDF